MSLYGVMEMNEVQSLAQQRLSLDLFPFLLSKQEAFSGLVGSSLRSMGVARRHGVGGLLAPKL